MQFFIAYVAGFLEDLNQWQQLQKPPPPQSPSWFDLTSGVGFFSDIDEKESMVKSQLSSKK